MLKRYETIKDMDEKRFKRLTGVRKETFKKMVNVVIKHEEARKLVKGRPQKLRYADQVLMLLEYLREYRTYYHISVNYGISESNSYKIIKKIEDILIKSKEFRIQDRRRLCSQEQGIKLIMIDTTETGIERPKKNKRAIIPAKRSDIH